MCGRFTLRTPPAEVAEAFGLFKGLPELTPRYNIAPTQMVLAVRQLEESVAAQFAMLRWGLIPSWADDMKIANRLLNARADSVADKPAFRAAFKRRRCLIVADGFYEWKAAAAPKGPKQPFHIHRRDGRPFAFAGLWETWNRGETEGVPPVESCTIITTDANGAMRPLHDRMPVILDPADYARWMSPAPGDPAVLLELLRPCPDDWLIAEPVNTLVNKPANEGPDLLKPPASPQPSPVQDEGPMLF